MKHSYIFGIIFLEVYALFLSSTVSASISCYVTEIDYDIDVKTAQVVDGCTECIVMVAYDNYQPERVDRQCIRQEDVCQPQFEDKPDGIGVSCCKYDLCNKDVQFPRSGGRAPSYEPPQPYPRPQPTYPYKDKNPPRDQDPYSNQPTYPNSQTYPDRSEYPEPDPYNDRNTPTYPDRSEYPEPNSYNDRNTPTYPDRSEYPEPDPYNDRNTPNYQETPENPSRYPDHNPDPYNYPETDRNRATDPNQSQYPDKSYYPEQNQSPPKYPSEPTDPYQPGSSDSNPKSGSEPWNDGPDYGWKPNPSDDRGNSPRRDTNLQFGKQVRVAFTDEDNGAISPKIGSSLVVLNVVLVYLLVTE